MWRKATYRDRLGPSLEPIDRLAVRDWKIQGSTMSEAKDTLLRLFSLLRLIPVCSGHIRGKVLAPAQSPLRMGGQVSSALLERCQCYLRRSKTALKLWPRHPAGLILRHSISYLTTSVDGCTDTIQLAMHCIRKAECLEFPAVQYEGVDLDGCFNDGASAARGQNRRWSWWAPSRRRLLGRWGKTPLS